MALKPRRIPSTFRQKFCKGSPTRTAKQPSIHRAVNDVAQGTCPHKGQARQHATGGMFFDSSGDVHPNAHRRHKAKRGQQEFAERARQRPTEGHALVLNELQFQNARHKRHPLANGKGGLDPELDQLVQTQGGQQNAPHQLSQSGRHCCCFASIERVACGTKRRRSLGINFPVTLQMP